MHTRRGLASVTAPSNMFILKWKSGLSSSTGRAAFLIDGEQRDAVVGDVVTVAPGIRHLAWNPTSGSVRLRIEMRPALRWQEFTERLFAGEEPATFLRSSAEK